MTFRDSLGAPISRWWSGWRQRVRWERESRRVEIARGALTRNRVPTARPAELGMQLPSPSALARRLRQGESGWQIDGLIWITLSPDIEFIGIANMMRWGDYGLGDALPPDLPVKGIVFVRDGKPFVYQTGFPDYSSNELLRSHWASTLEQHA